MSIFGSKKPEPVPGDVADLVSKKEIRETLEDVRTQMREERDVWTDMVKWNLDECTTEIELRRMLTNADFIIEERRKRFPL